MIDRNSDVDARYAQGEISRDEWMRLRQSAVAAPGLAPPPPPLARRCHTLLIAAVILVVVLVAVGSLVVYPLATSGTNPTYGALRRLTPAGLSALNASATAGLAFPSNHTLWFRTGPVALVVYASPPAHDLAFVVQGTVNPTIHVTPGTRVTVTVVNLDSDMYHNWALSTQGPPYSSMPMMGSGGMMGSGTMTGTSMLGPTSGGGYWSQTMSFAASAGSYWYLCEYPDHANEGMYGSFVVG